MTILDLRLHLVVDILDFDFFVTRLTDMDETVNWTNYAVQT